MSQLNKTQYDLLEDYAHFIRGQNSKTAHTAFRLIGGIVILVSIFYTSIFGIALGIVFACVTFLGNRQLKNIEAALTVAQHPHEVRLLNMDIHTELWENQTNFYAFIDTGINTRHKMYFVPVGSFPKKGVQVGTGYFLKDSTYPALIELKSTLIIPSKPPEIS